MASGTPLWRIVLSIMVLFLALQRIAAAVMVGLSHAAPWLVVLYAAQAAAVLFLWAALRWHGHLIIPAVLTAGGTFLATVIIGMAAGVLPPGLAFMEAAMAVMGTAAGAFLLKYGLQDDEHPGRR